MKSARNILAPVDQQLMKLRKNPYFAIFRVQQES